MDSPSMLTIRTGVERDIPLIREFIRGLAEYEKHLDYFAATEERLRQSLFGANPKAQVLLAYDNEAPVGFAVYYYTFSTFPGLPGLYLEDLFVKPEARAHGIGRALLKRLAQIAKQENCWRIEFAVLHWNETALGFYKKLGAVAMKEWSIYRLSGEKLDELVL